MAKKTSKHRWYKFGRWLCKIFCIVCFRMRISGKENVPENGAFVLISNHQSFLDPVFCGILLDRMLYFLARDTLFSNCVSNWILTSVNTIPIRRGEANFTAMKTIISKLKEGNGVCLFPEGTRTSNGKIAAFKPGFGLLCRRGNAAIVPVVVDGAFECWPRHKKVFLPGSLISVRYGKCITVEQVKKMNDKELAANLTETLRKMQTECRIKQGKEPYNY